MPRLVPFLLLAVILGQLLPACGPPRGDPILPRLERALGPGDRLILVRLLEPDPGTEPGDRIAVALRPASGSQEVRIYERRGKEYALAHTTRQGDLFLNLALEDVDGNGRPEILTTWEGGHLEILEVIARGEDGLYRTVFQNAGQEIERRHGPGGTVEFWITGRTYEEEAGQPPIYATTVYRWDGKGFSEVKP